MTTRTFDWPTREQWAEQLERYFRDGPIIGHQRRGGDS